MLPGGPELHAFLVAGGVAAVALGQLLLARRWDGMPLVVWLSAVALLLAPPHSWAAWGPWGAVALCALGTVWRRPAGLGRADRLTVALVLSALVAAAWAFGLPAAGVAAVGAVVAVGLVAITSDREPTAWRTRWVGEIPVHDKDAN